MGRDSEPQGNGTILALIGAGLGLGLLALGAGAWRPRAHIDGRTHAISFALMPDWKIRVEVLAQEGDVYVALGMYDGTGGDQSGAAALDSYLVDVLRDSSSRARRSSPTSTWPEPRSSASSRYRPI